MYHESTTRLKLYGIGHVHLLCRVLVCFEEVTNQASSFHAAIEGATCIRLSFTNTYIWSGARRFQFQYTEYNVYGIDRVGNVLEIIKTK